MDYNYDANLPADARPDELFGDEAELLEEVDYSDEPLIPKLQRLLDSDWRDLLGKENV